MSFVPDADAPGLATSFTGGVLRLRFERPDRRNSLTRPMMQRLVSWVENAVDEPETVPEAQPPPLADISRVLPPPQDRTVNPLPAPEKVEIPLESAENLASQAEASIQAGLEIPRPGPIGAVESGH